VKLSSFFLDMLYLFNYIRSASQFSEGVRYWLYF